MKRNASRWNLIELICAVVICSNLIVAVAWFVQTTPRARFERAFAALVAQTKKAQQEFEDPRKLNPNVNVIPPAACKVLEEMGPRIVPWLVEKESTLTSDNPGMLGYWITSITFKLAKGGDPNANTRRDGLVNWWKSRPEIPAKFEKAYQDYKKDPDKPPRRAIPPDWPDYYKQAEEYGRWSAPHKILRNFGMDALPLIIAQLEAGNDDLLHVFGEITDGKGIVKEGTKEQRIKFTLDWWAKNKNDWTLPPVSAAKLD